MNENAYWVIVAAGSGKLLSFNNRLKLLITFHKTVMAQATLTSNFNPSVIEIISSSKFYAGIF
jgi:hypothetical protein